MNTQTVRIILILLFSQTTYLCYSFYYVEIFQHETKSDADNYTTKSEFRSLTQNPDNGHYYEFVPAILDHSDAISAAGKRTYLGMPGYLATISDVKERNFVRSLLKHGESPWISGTDELSEDSWVFNNGPEIGKLIDYIDWGPGEPSNSGGTEHYLQIDYFGRFNDLSNKNIGHATGYLVEYGGLSQNVSRSTPIVELSYFQDSEKMVTSTNLLSVHFQSMPQSKGFGLNNGSYWFKLVLRNNFISAKRFVLEVPTHNLNELFVYKKEGERITLLAQNNLSFSDEVQHLNRNVFTYILEKDTVQQSTFYFHTEFQKEANFPLRVYHEDEYYEQRINHTSILNTYYGILIAVILFNLFLFFRLKEKVFIYYLYFLIAYSMAMLLCDNFLPRKYWYFEYFDSEAFLHAAVVITMFTFSCRFLDLRRFYPKINKLITVLVLLVGALEFIYLITRNYTFFALADIIAVISFLTMLGVSISLYKKLVYAKFYVFGYMVLIIYSHYHVLGYDFGLYKIDAYQNYFKIAGITDMVIFTYAITYRLESINKEHKTLIKDLQNLLSQKYVSSSEGMLYNIDLQEDSSENTLTMREMSVLECVSKGLSNSEIADQLFISQNTVKFHIRNIYQKLNVKSRVEVLDKIKILKLG